jgi:hypothetical protein
MIIALMEAVAKSLVNLTTITTFQYLAVFLIFPVRGIIPRTGNIKN